MHTKWEMVVDLIQTTLREGELTEEATWNAVIPILKWRDDSCGIGIVEVVWKAVTEILNLRFTASITYHNYLHGFRAGRGTGTKTL